MTASLTCPSPIVTHNPFTIATAKANVHEHGLCIVGEFLHTLAAAAAALAAWQASRSSSTSNLNMDQLAENITLEVVDNYGTGAYKPEDTVTIVSATLGLGGLYKVKRIERDMTDPNYAKLDLTTRHLEYWELDENLRRTVRNLNTLV